MSPYINRCIDLNLKLERRSQFLFGPRQTGKTRFIREQISKDDIRLNWDLLDNNLWLSVLSDPQLLIKEVKARGIKDGIIILDEVQKAPLLLNSVQLLIEESDIRFLLTGSSARKLREQGVNLLGGRASWNAMHPLVWPEIKDFDFDLDDIFFSGLLPSPFLNKEDANDILYSYTGLYVAEEIQREALVKKLPSFVHFLEITSMTSGEQINYANISSDVGVKKDAVKDWFSILTDTMLGFEVPSFKLTKKRKAVEVSKYYLFDVGVMRSLMKAVVPTENMSDYGRFFENYIATELRAYLDYSGQINSGKLQYWRSSSGFEVDFILNERVAIETKTTKHLTVRDLRGIKALMEEGLMEKYIIVTREDRPYEVATNITSMPWKYFLTELWAGRI